MPIAIKPRDTVREVGGPASDASFSDSGAIMADDTFIQVLLSELQVDEGVRLTVYDDATGKPLRQGDTIIGIPTIAIGRNLQDRGISQEISLMLAREDVDGAVLDLNRNVPWWIDLSFNRRLALVNMCFNMGWPRLSKFKKMWAALEEAHGFEFSGLEPQAKAAYGRAADEALDSKWAREDVQKDRSERLAKYIREG